MSNTNVKNKLIFNVTLDENHVPEKIEWQAEGQSMSSCKAVMASIWDEKEDNTLRIDLWTKHMMIEEMKHFFVQSLITMSDTFERATNDSKAAAELREFGKNFGEKLGVLKSE